jgi:dTDP-4-dehydrorhamnose 3,5-epimerase
MTSEILGVQSIRLKKHADTRGSFTELFRNSWVRESAQQWSLMSSQAGVLRGLHVHTKHVDAMVVLRGEAFLNLIDLRTASPTFRATQSVELSEKSLELLVIPPGVAHGFYCKTPNSTLVGYSNYYSPTDDEFRLRFNDPELGLTWPNSSPVMSSQDVAGPPLAHVLKQIAPWQSTFLKYVGESQISQLV